MSCVLKEENHLSVREFLEKMKIDEQNKCTFCNISNFKKNIGNNNFITLNRSEKKLSVIHFNKKNKLLGVMNIKYCPICGREL